MGMFIVLSLVLSASLLVRALVGAAAARDVERRLADVVDEAVVERLLGGEPAVAVTVGVDLLDGLAGGRRGDLGEALLHVENELRLGLDVTRGAAEAAVRLVQQDAG